MLVTPVRAIAKFFFMTLCLKNCTTTRLKVLNVAFRILIMAFRACPLQTAGRSSHLATVQGSSVDSSGISESETITETVSSDHELASAAAAVENDRTTLQEAVSAPGIVNRNYIHW